MIYDSRCYNLDGEYARYLITNPIEFHRFARTMHSYFKLKVTNKTKHASIFPVDILYYADFCKTVDMRKMLGSKNVKKISRGKAVLVFNFAHESFHPGNEDPEWDEFKLYVVPQLRKLNIPIKNVFFITGDLKTHSLNIDGAEELNLIGIDIFSELVSTRTSLEVSDTYFTKEIEFNLKKKKDFLYLNGCPRPGKCLLKYHLEQEDVLLENNSLYSWMHRHQKPSRDLIENLVTKYSVKYQNNADDILKSSNKKNLLDANHSSIGKLQDHFPRQFIRDTCYNLVPETSVLEPMFFITEKTYKTILFKHPLLFWGNSFMLKHLRSLGYVTFSTIFDESYDSIKPLPLSHKDYDAAHSLDNKLEIISNNIKNFRERAVGQEKMVNDILNHNRNLLLTNNPAIQFNKERLTVILEKVESL